MEPRETSLQWADKEDSHFRMVDVSSKEVTFRKAEATGSIRMGQKAFDMVLHRTLPKGDALKLAEISGILGVKQTPSLLPLCHPLPIEEVKVTCTPDEKTFSVKVICQVSTTSKTGVEMEALMGANAALLCLYDLIKMVDPALVVENIRLNFKEGGKSGLWKHPEWEASTSLSHTQPETLLSKIECAIVTSSDRVSQNQASDSSGPLAHQWLTEHGAKVIATSVVPDEKKALSEVILNFCEKGLPFLVISGGTGMGPRDITIQTLLELGAREMSGIGEHLRREGSRFKKSACLSNSGGFVLNQTFILALPGSPKAVEEGLNSVRDLIPHAVHILKGGHHG
ncbi:MAG: bifunctional molybdenum cofactor biosynthesis protein MoaC/MoaB [Deltaproteobacteria bacterium]